MAHVLPYRNYKFNRVDKDCIIDALRTVIKSELHLKNSMVHQITGVAVATLDGWFDGDTRKPQNATVCQVTGALGYARRDHFDRHGNVVPAFVKLRELDYRDEIAKQATFFLKHHPDAKKKKRKKPATNGHAGK
jgi:hypothetical protein